MVVAAWLSSGTSNKIKVWKYKNLKTLAQLMKVMRSCFNTISKHQQPAGDCAKPQREYYVKGFYMFLLAGYRLYLCYYNLFALRGLRQCLLGKMQSEYAQREAGWRNQCQSFWETFMWQAGWHWLWWFLRMEYGADTRTSSQSLNDSSTVKIWWHAAFFSY